MKVCVGTEAGKISGMWQWYRKFVVVVIEVGGNDIESLWWYGDIRGWWWWYGMMVLSG